jgi:aryl-alcohol dehydrogenase-like predicted oxidoreductase/enamine deaminase RidA (YjgF/YER057c/UK114 family)
MVGFSGRLLIVGQPVTKSNHHVTASVERCELAPGYTISRVLTGLWQIADMERDGGTLDPALAAATMQPYVDAGFTTFDMADHYGSAEEIVGCYRQQRDPGSVQLLTKWVPKPGSASREEVRAAVQRSLDRMQTDRIDLLQFHAWVYADPAWLDCLVWLQELKEEGLIRYLGMTNVDTAHLRIIRQSGIDVVSNQVCFSLIDQRAAHGMTELCLQHGVKLLVFGTVAGGFLTERWLGKPAPDVNALENWSLMKYRRFIDAAGGWDVFQDLLRTVDRVAQKHGVSVANVACRYILEEPAVGGIIVGARLGEREHIEDNLRLFQFTLDEASRAEIAEALARFQPIPGDCGDEYRKPPFLTAAGDLSHHVDSFPTPYRTIEGPDGRSRVLSGTPWEEMAGFSRAMRIGDRILVSGTTATHRDRPIGGTDPAAQAHFVIDKIEGALQSLGAQLKDVVRTRVYIQNSGDWEPVARVHGERFRDILPANTLVQAKIIGDEYLVEMEAEAVVR